jgi:hypothetical protein
MALHFDVLGPKGITIWGMVEMDMDGDKLQRLKNMINMALPKTVQVVSEAIGRGLTWLRKVLVPDY